MNRRQKEHDERLHKYSVGRMEREAEIAALRAGIADLKAKLALTELALTNATCTVPDTYTSAGVRFYSDADLLSKAEVERDALREILNRKCGCEVSGEGDELIVECDEHEQIRRERDALRTRLDVARKALEYIDGYTEETRTQTAASAALQEIDK
jgi:hypothetical protein